MGGLSKRIELIQTLQSKEQHTLLLEGGNCFFSPSIRVKQQISSRLPELNVIAKDYLHGQSAVYGIGSGDLAPGIEYLKTLLNIHAFTALSANIFDSKNQLLFTPATTVQAGPHTLGIIALTDHSLLDNAQDIQALPWEKAISSELEQLSQQSDFIMLLSNYAYKENVRIAEQFSNIRIILQSGYRASNLAPQQVNNAIICQTEKRGKYLGVLKISLEGNGFWEKKHTGEYRQMEREITQVTRLLSPYAQKDQLSENEKFKQEKLQAMLEQLQQKKALYLQGTQQTKGKGDLYTNRFMPLHDSLPEDEQVSRHVKEALEKRKALLKK
ncbi:bifunctional UDP-sugar hydrolase/5'-nucleotidase [Desulfogranum japonicum]|uniref:hypothetical protein n=1 Tax=Desulfogranum japonicum TaxID=231447 RepID=UPI00041E753D|nr:hypothetical protein [Desulfogranum japonicum]